MDKTETELELANIVRLQLAKTQQRTHKQRQLQFTYEPTLA